MPTYQKRYRRKRTYRGKRRSRYSPRKAKNYYQPKRSRGVTLNIGFPQVYTCKLRYCDQINLDAGAAAIASYYYNANSVFDPNKSAGGHQPRYFNQLETIYSSYVVRSSKITVHWLPRSASAVVPARVGVFCSKISGEIASFTDVEEFLEDPRTTNYKVVGGITSPSQVLTSRSYDAKKFFRVKDLMADDKMYAACTADPTRLATFALYATALVGNEPPAFYAAVVIDYVVTFFNRKVIGKST